MLVFATHDEDLASFKAAMETAYDVNDFEDASYFLGLELQWSPSGDEVISGSRSMRSRSSSGSTWIKRCQHALRWRNVFVINSIRRRR
ncbi:hypothetical protein GN244_ATG08269 [Phytophthora infestans]|uniref:Uncharacterized protein n=1 Tax=Phytophthora infestans TaxID=4787 RepID=A0A833WEP5_PHYIN|nr:hypothetical protein GN244_ATG08269 [Phytophthora infestans]